MLVSIAPAARAVSPDAAPVSRRCACPGVVLEQASYKLSARVLAASISRCVRSDSSAGRRGGKG